LSLLYIQLAPERVLLKGDEGVIKKSFAGRKSKS